MIALPVHLHQPRLKVGADLGEDMPQFLNRLAVEHTAAVFGDEDQMDMHCKDAVSTVPNFLEVRHRPNHNGTLERGKGSNSSCCRTVNSNGRRAVRLVAPVRSTTRRWLSSKSATRRKRSSPASNWTSCWCSGSKKRHGWHNPHATHYNKPSWTSTVLIPTFSRSEPSSRSFTRRACGIHSESPTRSASNWTKSTAAFRCQRSVGCVIATAVRCSARFAVSPSAYRLASGWSASARCAKSSRDCSLRDRRSVWMGESLASIPCPTVSTKSSCSRLEGCCRS